MPDGSANLPVAALADMPVARLMAFGIAAIEQAGSFDAVREIRATVEALRVLQQSRDASFEAINAATQLRIRADRRMGEMLAATERARGGEPYHQATGDTLSPVVEPTYADIGIGKKAAQRLQQLAAIPEPQHEAILAAHEQQRVPITTAGVLRAAARAEAAGQTPEEIRAAPLPTPEAKQRAEARWFDAMDRANARELPVEKSTGEYEWNTPPEIIELARQVLGRITLDPASNPIAQKIIRATRFHTMENDGLSVPWRGRVWLNPPYAQPLVGQFVEKLVQHIAAGDVTSAILLVDNKTDTQWFDRAASTATRFCFTRGRINFLRPDGSPGSPTNGSVLLYFGDDAALFAKTFRQIGRIMRNA